MNGKFSCLQIQKSKNGIKTEWSEDDKKTFQGNFVDGNEEQPMNKKLTFLLALTVFSLLIATPVLADKTRESRRVSLENYVYPKLKSLDVAQLIKLGFYPPARETNQKKLTKVINQYPILVVGSENYGTVFWEGSQVWMFTPSGIKLPKYITLDFGKLSGGNGWVLLTHSGHIEDYTNDNASMLSPEFEVYIKSKFKSMEFFTFLTNKNQ